MSTTTPFSPPILGGDGEPCRTCGSPLAADQRYCLECGSRRGDTRVPFGRAAAVVADEPASPTAPVPVPPRGSEWTPLTAIGLVAVIALILLAGILVGQGLGGSDDGSGRVVTVGSGAASGSAGASGADTAAFKSDWPTGKEGYTVELGSLDKGNSTAADVQTAKDDATSKGATDVGALDSDDFASLPSGNYVVYSGVFDSKDAANKALAKLKGDFPDAKVAKVSTKATAQTGGGGGGGTTVDSQALKQLDSATGDAYVEKSKKLPDETKVQGEPPPKDNKAPGGGSGAEEIK